jgi:Holliday junction resolvase RusA-like endonuclease
MSGAGVTAREIAIDLPFPVSTNRIWRRAAKGIRVSEEYRTWKESADRFVTYTGSWKHATKIAGRFTAEIVLDSNERRRAKDLDNYVKVILDWCQSRELIRNDSDCERLLVEWGDAPHGCRLMLRATS